MTREIRDATTERGRPSTGQLQSRTNPGPGILLPGAAGETIVTFSEGARPPDPDGRLPQPVGPRIHRKDDLPRAAGGAGASLYPPDPLTQG